MYSSVWWFVVLCLFSVGVCFGICTLLVAEFRGLVCFIAGFVLGGWWCCCFDVGGAWLICFRGCGFDFEVWWFYGYFDARSG